MLTALGAWKCVIGEEIYQGLFSIGTVNPEKGTIYSGIALVTRKKFHSKLDAETYCMQFCDRFKRMYYKGSK